MTEDLIQVEPREADPAAFPELNDGKFPHPSGLASTPTPRQKRRPDLARLPDVRRQMAKIYWEMRHGKCECQNGTRMVYVLEKIAKLIETGDLVARIEALEAKSGRKN